MAKSTKDADIDEGYSTGQSYRPAEENPIITIEDLTLAIHNSPNSRGMQDADALARHVLNFFGYSDRIIDNILEPEDRDTFYMLEDASILTTEREETTLYDGREWRIHYWLFRKDKIRELMLRSDDSESDDGDLAAAYRDLPMDIWDRS